MTTPASVVNSIFVDTTKECVEVFYNRRRRHPAIDYRTPAQPRIDMTMAQAA